MINLWREKSELTEDCQSKLRSRVSERAVPFLLQDGLGD
jgi:hypothetical protein